MLERERTGDGECGATARRPRLSGELQLLLEYSELDDDEMDLDERDREELLRLRLLRSERLCDR